MDLFNPGVIKRQACGQMSPGDLCKQSSGIAQYLNKSRICGPLLGLGVFLRMVPAAAVDLETSTFCAWLPKTFEYAGSSW